MQTKAVFVDRWSLFTGSIHWNNVKSSTKEVTGKKKNLKIISNVQNVQELKWVFLPEHFLAFPALKLLLGTFTQKRRFRIVTRSLYTRNTGRRCTKNSVAGRARQVVAVRSAVSVWNCPCTKKRSLEAGGRYSRWSRKAGFTVLFPFPRYNGMPLLFSV